MKIIAMDHLVLTVRDLEKTCAFYTKTLGMEHRISGAARHSLHFGRAKINLHQQGNEFQPHAMAPTPGSADLCFITEVPIEQVIAHLRQLNVELIEGPVKRTGATGDLLSIYFRDPDGNLLEIANVRAKFSST
jgi:catechol 2,3-dioxygenase-like lactoylglutathione lyase family enzyme